MPCAPTTPEDNISESLPRASSSIGMSCFPESAQPPGASRSRARSGLSVTWAAPATALNLPLCRLRQNRRSGPAPPAQPGGNPRFFAPIAGIGPPARHRSASGCNQTPGRACPFLARSTGLIVSRCPDLYLSCLPLCLTVTACPSVDDRTPASLARRAAFSASHAAIRACGWRAGRAAAAPCSRCRVAPAPRRTRSDRTARRTSRASPGAPRAPDRGSLPESP